MAPPYLGEVNSTNMPYAQQLPVTAIEGQAYTYANQSMYSQPQNSYTQTQNAYPQPRTHISKPQNFNM